MPRPTRPTLVAAFAAIYLFWGATFLTIRWAVAEVPPMLTIALRCGAGGALLLLWLAFRGEWVRPSVRSWAIAGVAGTLLFLGCHSVMATVEQRVSSGETALLMTSIPLWMVLVESIRKRTAPPPLVVLGLLSGAAGVALLTGGAVLSGGSAGDRLALVLCALAWAVGSLVARDGERPASAVQATAMQLLAGALVVTVAGALSPERARWAAVHLTPRAAGSLVFLVVCGTALGMASYTSLMRVASPAAVGTYAFVNPVIALLLGRAVGDDQLGPRSLAAAALVVTGVVLIQQAAARSRASRRIDGPVELTRAAPGAPGSPGHERRTAELDPGPARLWVRSEG
jgi:drug/metabolite transporter (DMT)-like permease